MVVALDLVLALESECSMPALGIREILTCNAGRIVNVGSSEKLLDKMISENLMFTFSPRHTCKLRGSGTT